VKVNDKIRGPDYFAERFKILFDIPEESIKKLASALRSIEDKLTLYRNYTQDYFDKVSKDLRRIEDYQDKEKRVKDKELNLESQKTTLEGLQMRLKVVKEKLGELKKAHVIVSFEKLKAELLNADTLKKKALKRLRQLKSKGAAGGTPTYQKLTEEFKTTLNDLRFSVDTSDALSGQLGGKDRKKLNSVRKEIGSTLTFRDLSDEKLKKWYKFFNDTLTSLKSRSLHKKKFAEEDEKKLLDGLIPVLKDYIDVDATIPGTGGQKVAQFIKTLEDRRDEIESGLSEKFSLNKATEVCGSVVTSLGSVATARAQVPKSGSTADSEYYEIKAQVESLEEEFASLLPKIDSLADPYDSIPQSERDDLLNGKDRDRIEEDFENTKDEEAGLQDKIRRFEIKIESSGESLKELKKTKKPMKESDIEGLKSFYETASTLIRKINSFGDHISHLDLARMEVDEEMDEEAEEFYSALGNYFAFALEVIYFEDKSWKLKKVDLVERCYEVKGRDPIGFLDIGTGHTALNALLARLKQDYGGKKKILLFDEIGHMDQNNVDRLLKEIKEQVKSGDVIFAMLNQMDNNADKPIMDSIEV
jgi:hypothetical protein